MLFPWALYAQDGAPYEDVTIGIRYSNNVAKNEFLNAWNPQNGFNGYAITPFYFGRLQAGLRIIEFEAKTEDIPDFLSWYIYAGWGKGIKIFKKLEIYSSINAGSFQMNFNDPSLQDGLRNESEFALELNTSLSYPVIEKLYVSISGTYQQICHQT